MNKEEKRAAMIRAIERADKRAEQIWQGKVKPMDEDELENLFQFMSVLKDDMTHGMIYWPSTYGWNISI